MIDTGTLSFCVLDVEYSLIILFCYPLLVLNVNGTYSTFHLCFFCFLNCFFLVLFYCGVYVLVLVSLYYVIIIYFLVIVEFQCCYFHVFVNHTAYVAIIIPQVIPNIFSIC